MALIKEVRGHTPVIGENTFLAETAVILGDVTIGRDCSIWYNAVLRGDVNKIVIGDRTNIQDGVVLHTIYDLSLIHIYRLWVSCVYPVGINNFSLSLFDFS